MKILSKYKDYYDYYQGIFGMDNAKVYDRRDVTQFDDTYINMDATQEQIFTFAVCGIEYSVRYFRGNFYHTVEELKELDTLMKSLPSRYGRYHADGINTLGWYSQNTDFQAEFDGRNYIKTDINKLKRQPVLFTSKDKGYTEEYSIPLLSSFNFHKIMDAKTIYIEIETFLGWLVDNPPLPDDQTNVGKIEGHGFDKKYSFRPQMK